MDKAKIKNHIKDIECFLKMMVDKAPKVQNQINSIGWALRSIREEIDKPDATTESASRNDSVVTKDNATKDEAKGN